MSDSHGHGSGKRLLIVGFGVAAILTILTGVEYVIAQDVEGNLAPIFAIALVKVGLILWFFMHVARCWAKEESS